MHAIIIAFRQFVRRVSQINYGSDFCENKWLKKYTKWLN